MSESDAGGVLEVAASFCPEETPSMEENEVRLGVRPGGKFANGGNAEAHSSSSLGESADRMFPIVFVMKSSSSESESNPLASMTGFGELD